MVNGLYSTWSLVTSGVLQGAILGPILFKTFINDLEETKCTLIKLADNITFGGAVDMLEDRAVI